MGEHEDFCVAIDDETVQGLMDGNRDIRFDKVLEWFLPRFGDGNDALTLCWEW